jgi:hypothetical protein
MHSLSERVWQAVVDLIRCAAVKRGVAALGVLKADPRGEPLTKLGSRVERV